MINASTAAFLHGCSLFAELGEDEVAAIAEHSHWVTVEAGEVVVRKGETGDDFYIVASGALVVIGSQGTGEGVIGRLHPGEYFGEVALVERTPRMATVRATTASRLLRLGRDDLLRALSSRSESLALVRATAAHRRALDDSRRYRPSREKLLTMLATLTQVEDPEALSDLEAEVQWISLPGETVLMREGTTGDQLYFVVSGRLLLFSEQPGGTRVRIGEVGPGETVGEMSILSDSPRSATVETQRDSELLAVTRVGFDRLLAVHPKVLRNLVALLVRRIQAGMRARLVTVQTARRPEVTPEVCQRVVDTAGLVLRNLKITQTYHQLSLEMATVLGHQNANWCTFATHASKTAGYSIRHEELPMYGLWWSLRQCERVDAMATRVEQSFERTLIRLGITAKVIHTSEVVSHAISAGNLKVFREIAPIIAEFVQICHGQTQYEPDSLQPLRDRLQRGPVATGGQDLLDEAITHYYDAAFERDARRRAELIMLANCKVGLHEQTRLQHNIVEALDAPVRTGLALCLRDAGRLLPAGLRRRLAPLNERGLAVSAVLWRRAVTRSIMRIRLPYGAINLGRRLPRPQSRRMFPEVLQEPRLPELVALIDRYTGKKSRRQGARDWGVIEDRMTFIVNLFRSRQTALELFTEPFLLSQEEHIKSGAVPRGWL